MIDLVWLVPALPLAGFIVNLLAGRRLGRSAGWLATIVMGVATALAIAIGLDLLSHPAEERTTIVHLFDWIHVGSFSADVDLRVDQLSVLMVLVVMVVGSLIHLYSIGYMEGDPRFGRFFAYLNLFVFFMLVLVLAENLLLLYVGWEGVGLCSYLLIGFWFDRPSAANAAKKAFVTTRIGDTFMLVGIALVFLRLGSLELSTVLDPAIAAVQPSGVFTVIALLLLAGAIGKSAQVPLHVWLPDAMEGPTPVSALIHAATMVTAGVYLVVRTHLFFEISGVALAVVLVVGLVTALYAALSALGQDDIKRVLAYSTVSQLGFMFMAAGMRAYSVAMFMLAAHAAYKALGAVLSALYIGRLVFLTFFGSPRSEEAEHAHESPPVMLGPLGVLAAGAVGLGALMVDPETGRLPEYLEPVLGAIPHGAEGVGTGALIVLSQVAALGGLLVTWLTYASGRVDWLALRVRAASLQRFLDRGMYVDDLYARVLVAPAKAGSAFLASVVDARVVDGLVNGFGVVVQWLAGAGRQVQTGLVRNYALGFLLGALVLLVYVGARG